MSIIIKICHGRGADADVGSMFGGHHVPEGGSFSIDPSTEEVLSEDYAYLTIFDKGGVSLGSVPIKGNLYVMDNGKTVSSFWGGKKYPTRKAYEEMDRQAKLNPPAEEEKKIVLQG